jgi:hypothetical protein
VSDQDLNRFVGMLDGAFQTHCGLSANKTEQHLLRYAVDEAAGAEIRGSATSGGFEKLREADAQVIGASPAAADAVGYELVGEARRRELEDDELGFKLLDAFLERGGERAGEGGKRGMALPVMLRGDARQHLREQVRQGEARTLLGEGEIAVAGKDDAARRCHGRMIDTHTG